MEDRGRLLSQTVKVDNVREILESFQGLFQIPVALLDVRGQTIADKSLGEILSRNEILDLVSINQRTYHESKRQIKEKGIVAEAIPIVHREKLLGSWVYAYPAGSDHNSQITEYIRTVSRILEVTIDNSEDTIHILDDFLHLTDENVCLTDFQTGEIILYNDTLQHTLKENEGIDDLQDVSMYDFESEFIPEHILRELKQENPDLKKSYSWSQYVTYVDKWYGLTSRAVRWIDGRLTVLTTFKDITASKKEEERMHYLVYNDKRLGIPNGIKLFEDLKESAPVTDYMLCFNVQGLRKVNNLYGRETGDKLLKNIVIWASTVLNFKYTIYRIEKDDFVILIQDSTELEAMNLARYIYNRFEQPWDVDLDAITQEIFVGVHMGVIAVDTSIDSYEQMQNMVEKVMTYARKENRLILFDDILNNNLKDLLKFEEDLKYCVLHGMRGFSLNYQPFVEVASGRWVGCEALCRWNRPDHGPVPPDVFILEAEKMGLISFVTDWVLNEALRQIKAWKLDQRKNFMLDVNLSPLQLRDRELVGAIREALHLNRYPAERLSLEVTESADVNFDDKAIKQLDYIKESGVSLSLDDFGVGYATFASLRKLPVDVLKTDRSFIQGIESDEYTRYTIKVMVDFAHAAGMRVVAEGVETLEQKDILRKMGVNMIQGYYYSRPLSAEQMEEQLDQFL